MFLQEKVWTSTTGIPKWNQSPIDLNSMYTIHHNFPILVLQGHLACKGPAKMINTGNTVKIEFIGNRVATLKGGPLNDEYQFSDLQFRWGSTNAFGAEHSINSVWFSMEAQAIHWNKRYGSIDKCYEKPDGIAIIAFLFQVIGCPGMPDNPNFLQITDNLNYIKLANKYTILRPDCLKWIAEAISKPGYYTYTGSLTTYPYSECVTWIVIPCPIVISARQADAFRRLYNNKTELITHNFRSQQKIHDRKIFYAIG
ncbi:PREDICTED: carbonic anhydrase 2-like [Ceratosolen solmsi marchali]|uniref:Carbonic anhydrase 2-like n=1 Tax=Ceratosolen solmsi marchali TaxID=326594 RepID=A0AAJ6YP27_9HYME|nr:PREDICTED: carbonic anhydrase 2-like [Ceratosolen solmsi marchali]